MASNYGFFVVDSNGNIKLATAGGSGSGTVTNTGTLTSNQLILGNGGVDIKTLGSAGTSTTVLHGGSPPTYGAVSLTADVTGDLPFSNLTQASAASKLLGRGDSGAGDYQEITLGSGLSMSGTTISASGSGIGDLLDIKFIRKTADESVTSSTALQNDDDFVLAIGANEVWTVEGVLFLNAGTVGDFQWAWNAPSGASGWNTGIRIISGASGASADVALSAIEDLTDTGFRVSGGAGATVAQVRVSSIVINGANAGNIQFRWAQDVSSGTATTLEAGSYMIFHRWA